MSLATALMATGLVLWFVSLVLAITGTPTRGYASRRQQRLQDAAWGAFGIGILALLASIWVSVPT